MPDTDGQDILNLLQDLIAQAKKAGADAADAVLFEGASLSHAQRLGKIEKLERSEAQDLGLRVFIGKRQAMRVVERPRAGDARTNWSSAPWRWRGRCPKIRICGLADPDADRA